MTETIASAALAVHENLNIQKRRIQKGEKKTRLSLVTGTHGDELEGQYLAYMVGSFIDKNIDMLDGIVDIYPALNPMGIDSITRGIPIVNIKESGSLNISLMFLLVKIRILEIDAFIFISLLYYFNKTIFNAMLACCFIKHILSTCKK